jgi:hypothetical protein
MGDNAVLSRGCGSYGPITWMSFCRYIRLNVNQVASGPR